MVVLEGFFYRTPRRSFSGEVAFGFLLTLVMLDSVGLSRPNRTIRRHEIAMHPDSWVDFGTRSRSWLD